MHGNDLLEVNAYGQADDAYDENRANDWADAALTLGRFGQGVVGSLTHPILLTVPSLTRLS
jgi:hypothetical protein